MCPNPVTRLGGAPELDRDDHRGGVLHDDPVARGPAPLPALLADLAVPRLRVDQGALVDRVPSGSQLPLPSSRHAPRAGDLTSASALPARSVGRRLTRCRAPARTRCRSRAPLPTSSPAAYSSSLSWGRCGTCAAAWW
jgi:hypothetical protein